MPFHFYGVRYFVPTSEWFVNAANHASINCLPDEDEMAVAGLTPMPAVKIKPCLVGESAVQMECKLVHSYDVINAQGKATTTMFLGEVLPGLTLTIPSPLASINI